MRLKFTCFAYCFGCERLLDHHQLKSIQLTEELHVVKRVRRICINHQRHVGKLSPHCGYWFDVPAGLDLDLDASITFSDVTSHSIEQLIHCVKDADSHARWNGARLDS